jgi:hypothetical protein
LARGVDADSLGDYGKEDGAHFGDVPHAAHFEDEGSGRFEGGFDASEEVFAC